MGYLKLGKETSSQAVNDLINRLTRLNTNLSGRKIALKAGSVLSRHIITIVKRRSGIPYSKKYRNRRQALGLVVRAVVEIGKKQIDKSSRKRNPPISYKYARDGKGGYKVRVGWHTGSIGKGTGHSLSGQRIAEIREARRHTIEIDSTGERKVKNAINTIINRAIYFFKNKRPGRKPKN